LTGRDAHLRPDIFTYAVNIGIAVEFSPTRCVVDRGRKSHCYFLKKKTTFLRERLEIVVINLAAAISFQRELLGSSHNPLLYDGNQRKVGRII
jgi:hypothetical protein